MRVLCGAVLLVAMTSQAQMQHVPDGGSRETIQSILVPVKAGAPFKAQVFTSWKRRLEDGTETTVYNRRTIARDSMGRVLQERHLFAPDGNTVATAVYELDFEDPQFKTSTTCVTRTRQCMVRHWVREPLPTNLPQLPASQTFSNGVKVTREALGRHMVDSVETQGTREITTDPRMGAAEPSVREIWYSPKLDVNLVVKRFLPRGGAQDFVVEHIDENEPDAGLFQLPKGYQVVDIPAPLPVAQHVAQ